MPFNPGIQDRSGEILGAGMADMGRSIGRGIADMGRNAQMTAAERAMHQGKAEAYAQMGIISPEDLAAVSSGNLNKAREVLAQAELSFALQQTRDKMAMAREELDLRRDAGGRDQQSVNLRAEELTFRKGQYKDAMDSPLKFGEMQMTGADGAPGARVLYAQQPGRGAQVLAVDRPEPAAQPPPWDPGVARKVTDDQGKVVGYNVPKLGPDGRWSIDFVQERQGYDPFGALFGGGPQVQTGGQPAAPAAGAPPAPAQAPAQPGGFIAGRTRRTFPDGVTRTYQGGDPTNSAAWR